MADIIDFAAAKQARESGAKLHTEQDTAPVRRKAGEQCPDVDLNDRGAVIRAIRDALRQRSGKTWSVTGGRGTAYGWLHVTSPPARRVGGGMTEEDREELSKLLGESVPHDNVSVPDRKDYRAEYVARARGLVPEVRGKPYWD